MYRVEVLSNDTGEVSWSRLFACRSEASNHWHWLVPKLDGMANVNVRMYEMVTDVRLFDERPAPRQALEHHVTGAIERGEAEPIVEQRG